MKAFEDALETHMWKFVQAVGMQLELLLAECALCMAPVEAPFELLCCCPPPTMQEALVSAEVVSDPATQQ